MSILRTGCINIDSEIIEEYLKFETELQNKYAASKTKMTLNFTQFSDNENNFP